MRAAGGIDLGTTFKYLRGAAGIGLGTTIKYLRRLTSGAPGNGLCTTIKYLRGAAGIGLGTTIKYLRRTASAAANNGLSTAMKYHLNQIAGAGNSWAKAHVHKSWARIQTNPLCSLAALIVNSESRTGARPSVRLCVGPELARCIHQRTYVC